ncbi:MAG: hypothetical protein EPN38_01610 [Rhodanobacteraceae bacterium]|nr:MAG: hypothetical protein EPN38_01610 [Rhodanobacteraceae bacterium]
MADQAQTDRARVALIFGDAAAVKHLRDAVSGPVDLVYDVQASDFDVAKLVAARARAALINLDSFEWLDTIGAQLSKAGVAVVFNDPEISSQLEGWEHARWLRHLVAKLRGSDDYDPPRPVVGTAAPVTGTPVVPAPAVTAAPSVPPAVAAVAAAPASPAAIESVLPSPPAALPAVELPLSAREIDTLTADFAAAPGVDAAVAPAGDSPGPAVPAAADPNPADGAADELDVDTEALSALIDARLAEPEQRAPAATDAGPADAAAVVADVGAPGADGPLAAPPPDDSDVLAELPALDDWQLLDPDAPVAPVAGSAHPEPAASTLSGLELVPLERDAPLELHSEPVEHRLYVEARKQQAAAEPKAADANGDHA